MRTILYTRPRFLRGLVTLVIIPLLMFSNCTSGRGNIAVDERFIARTEQNGIITFENNTPFRANITVGLMARELDPIEPWASLSVPNIYSATEIYYLSFDIPLLPSGENYDLLNIRPAGIFGHFQIDGSARNQNIKINPPPSFDLNNGYVVITNNSNTGGVYLSENQISRFVCIHEHRKDNIDQHASEVFQIRPQENKVLYLSGPVDIEFPAINYRASNVYYFLYDGTTITLTDVRPLHRVGEESWIEVTDATGTEPIRLVVANDEIHVFASTESGLIRNAYNSAGNLINSRLSERIPSFTFAGAAEGCFFVAGYEELANRTYRSIARMQNTNGVAHCVLARSNEYGNARFLTAAKKDNNTWLLAGDGARNGTFGNTAYSRLVRLENDELITVWEHGGNDFKGNNTINECRKITSAVYDHVRDSWLVTGENINQRDSFVAEISGDGTITINQSFRNMLFNKILIDSDGICYLAGEEQRGNETYAILVKYTINNNHSQRIFTQAASNSYYHDALIDTANNRVILGGVMRAADESGRDGVPFVEAIDIQAGTLLWREELSNSEIINTGAVLVTAIASAPDYGFALALSGIINGNFGKPFIITRINSQGKFLRRVR